MQRLQRGCSNRPEWRDCGYILQLDSSGAGILSMVLPAGTWLVRRRHRGCAGIPYVWEKIAPMIEGLPLVAHNSNFDEGCLKEVFKVYQMDYPDYEFYDTLAASRKHFGCSLPNHQLQTVAAACGYDLENHHHALADAEACAHIAMKLL